MAEKREDNQILSLGVLQLGTAAVPAMSCIYPDNMLLVLLYFGLVLGAETEKMQEQKQQL